MEHPNVTQDHSGSRGIVDRVKQQATSQFSSQKDRATEGLANIANAIRQSSQPLRDNNQQMLADYVTSAADQIEQFSSRLRDADMDSVLRQAKQFAHRQPAVFVGAAFALGVVAVRFLKSSADAPLGHPHNERLAYPIETRSAGGF
jgi:hypothetical protein